MGRSLELRNMHFQFLFVPIRQAQEFVTSQHESPLPLRRLMRNLILLHYIAADQDHERQAHGQAHRLDGSV